MLENKIKLESRYRDVETYYTPITEDSGFLSTNGQYVRCVLNEDKTAITGVDFEGGPMLYVGEEMPETNKKIKSIKTCYYVELE